MNMQDRPTPAQARTLKYETSFAARRVRQLLDEHPEAFAADEGDDMVDDAGAALPPEQLAAVNDSDAMCEGCGANPRTASSLTGWFVDTIMTDGAAVAVIRCPRCW